MDVNPRFVPALLLRGTGLVKTIRFEGGTYLGDAVNTVAIFNDKMVDEIAVLDIDARRERRGPNFSLLRDLASECFMPLTYGGGISTLAEVEAAIAAGAEKVVLTTAAHEQPSLVEAAARLLGSQSVVVGLDVRRAGDHYETCVQAGRVAAGVDPVTAARRAVDLGAGEILVQSLDRDGTRDGYDRALVRAISSAVDISIIALGGARDLQDMAGIIVHGGASAAAAGSLFVFFGRRNAVLVSVPSAADRAAALLAARAELAPANE